MKTDLVAATTRRAVISNQIEQARYRYRDLLRIGFKGGLYEATDATIASLHVKMQTPGRDAELVLTDSLEMPFLLSMLDCVHLMEALVEANAVASREYLSETQRIVAASKEDLIKEDA